MSCRGLPPFLARCLLTLAASWMVACTSTTTPKLSIGSDCGGQDLACSSGKCAIIDVSTSMCTIDCQQNADCPADFLCANIRGVEQICLPAGLAGRCLEDNDCAAGFRCDADSNRCFIPVTRTLCAPCTSTKQCPEGGVCSGPEGNEYCTTACGEGDTCPTGFVCEALGGTGPKQCLRDNEARSCIVGKDLCAPCRNDQECGDEKDFCVRNLASNERFCGTNCNTDADCPTNFSCTDISGKGYGPNQCVPNTNTCRRYCDSDDPATVLLQCGFGATCDVPTRTCIQATDGTLCAACNNDDDCASLVEGSRCLQNNCANCPFQGERFCSLGCTPVQGSDQGDCPDGFACSGAGAAGSFCLPRSGSCKGGAGKLGDDCAGGGADACRSGVCLELGITSMCSVKCTADAECGDPSFKCCGRTGDNDLEFDCGLAPGAAGGVCAPIGGALGADCSPGQPPCLEGVCLDLGTTRICSPQCVDDASCPTDFTCRMGLRPRGDGTNEEVKVCFPQGGGDIGADCTFGPAACVTGFCLKKGSGNICTAECSATAPCPDDYDCESTPLSLDDLSKTMDVCVPSRTR